MAREADRLRASLRVRRLEAAMEAVFSEALANLVKKVMAHAGIEPSPTSLTASVAPTDLKIILGLWQKEIDKGITPKMEAWYREQFDIASSLLPTDVNVFLGPNVRDVRATQYVKQVRNRLVGIGDTMYEHATDVLRTSLETGEGAAKAAMRVADALQVSTARATTIARTEAAGAVNGADQAIAQELQTAGIVTMKTWLATSDDRTRESHVEADGQSVDVNEPFDVGGEELMYPGDPDGEAGEVINCRCTTILELADN